MHTFKEWQIICEALHQGEQSIILRKGGIHEGKDGFSFQSIDEFLLFPTRFHAQGSLVHQVGSFSPGKEWEVGDEVLFNTLCKVEKTYELTDWETVKKLAPFHLWTEQCIQDRFDWEGKGMQQGKIHLALIRVYALSHPIVIPYEKRLGGCRSWVHLEEVNLSDQECSPVVPDADFSRLSRSIDALI